MRELEEKQFMFFLMGYVLVVCILYLFTYILLHEGGHALSTIILGGTVTAFNINGFNAHVSIEGISSPGTRSIVDISGFLFPTFVWGVFMIIIPKRTNLWGELLKIIISISILAPFFTWMFIPFLYMNNSAPVYDDVTHFLVHSKIEPLYYP